MKTVHRRISIVLAGCALAILAAVPGARPQANSAKPAQSSPKPNHSADPPLIDLAGYKQVLATFRGKPLLVTFWATWCEPCRDEFPMVVELAKRYAPQGLAVFGVSLDDDADMNLVRRFISRNAPGFRNYRQKPGIDVDAFYHGVNPNWTGAMPETIFYGRDGRIVGHFIGEQPRAAFEQGIHMVLENRGATSGGS